MGVRKSLDIFFTKAELKILDDILPEFKRKERLNDEEDALDDGTNQQLGEGGEGGGEIAPAGEYNDEELAKRRASLRYVKEKVLW